MERGDDRVEIYKGKGGCNVLVCMRDMSLRLLHD